MKQFQENVPLLPYTTFKMGGSARFFMDVESEEELAWALRNAETQRLALVILGGGSNVVVKNGPINALVAHIAICGSASISRNKAETLLRVGAGEIWDRTVARTVAMGLSGIEALSGIPGTVGATPIQNVGAYGQEVKNAIAFVRAYDRTTRRFIELPNEKCGFAYRDSLFKHEEKDRYVVTAVTFRLSVKRPEIPQYPDLIAYFADKSIKYPTLEQIRNAVLEIRSGKLPDPASIPSVGSFFKNPVISETQASALKERYPTMPQYPAAPGFIKLAAGWLIDQAGFKGKQFGPISVYERNALVLVNAGNASFKDLETAVEKIKNAVQDRFDVQLEQEPDVIG